MLFQRVKGAAADDVFNFAGVVDSGFLVYAERHEQLAEDGVAFVGAFRDLKSRFGQVQTAVAGNGDISSVTQDSDRAADAWLGFRLLRIKMVSRYISPDSLSCIIITPV